VEIVKRGKAAATVCSTTFENMGRGSAKAMGQPDLPILIVSHPFGLRTREEIAVLAEQCAADLATMLDVSRTAGSA
jgi:hypothetical protein